MTAAPPTVASRRSVLRAATVVGVVGAAGSVVGLAPGVIGIAAQAAPATPTAATSRRLALKPKKRKKCKRSQVKVKGRCKPRKTPTTAPVPTAPPTPPTTPNTQGTPTPPTPVPSGTLLDAADRHLVTRFSYGVDTALADSVHAAGGGAAWFESQISGGASDPATDGLKAWWPSLGRTASDLWKRQVDEVEGGWLVMADYQRYLLVRRMRSTRPVLDVMTEFWENHLNVPVCGDAQFVHRTSYGDAIRGQALGRFDSLLTAAITHPAMLIYLNGAVSTAAHPNENLGRELLELHTVGRGQYSEDDVKASARILTGYRVDMWNTWAASYRPADHWVGPVTVMGFSSANSAADGRAVATAYLTYLARHPATAQRIARKLALKFVSDTPSQALVDQLAQTYLANDTAIAPVLRTLVGSAEFRDATLAKVRDPGEDVVATYRALGLTVAAPTPARDGTSAEMAILWQTAGLGAMPHGWPRPDGAPATNAAWSSPSRILASLELHNTMSGGWWPTQGVTYRAPAQWLPAASVSFRDLVEHLCNLLLHLPTPAGVLDACCLAANTRPDEVITAQHPLVKWSFQRLLTAILDTPHFLKR